MKLRLLIIQAMPVLMLVLFTTPIQAGPSCDVRPNRPNCEPGNGDPGPVYQVTFLNIITGTVEFPGIFTTPGTLDGDESGLGANGNGPNVVKFLLYDFLSSELGTEGTVSCFPPDHRLNGSIQMLDRSQSGGDPYRMGYIWVHAFTKDGEEVQYAIDLFDVKGSWVDPLLPDSSGVSTRTVTHWELRTTKKKYKNACGTDGLVVQADDGFTAIVEQVATNPWYE